METGKQIASMEAWQAISAPQQVEIVIKAAKKAVYVAAAYGVVLTVDEIMDQTWEGTVKRLGADRLDKANAKRASENKAPFPPFRHLSEKWCLSFVSTPSIAQPLEFFVT